MTGTLVAANVAAANLMVDKALPLSPPIEAMMTYRRPLTANSVAPINSPPPAAIMMTQVKSGREICSTSQHNVTSECHTATTTTTVKIRPPLDMKTAAPFRELLSRLCVLLSMKYCVTLFCVCYFECLCDLSNESSFQRIPPFSHRASTRTATR